MKRLMSFLLIALLAGACETFSTPEPEEVADFKIVGLTLNNFPFIDCSTSTSPLRDMVMYSLLDISWRWGLDIASGSQYAVWFNLPKGMKQGSAQHLAFTDRIHELDGYSGSHGAYVNLIEGSCDVIIDSRDISRNETEYASQNNVRIVTKPLAWDALVFIVHPDNPVQSLTQDQIRRIYTGDITNWKALGGEDHEIHPYTRDPDSGSQEKMEMLVMNGLTMIDGTYMAEIIGSQMASPYMQLEADEYGIGYTPFLYCTAMVRDLLKVDMISIDGVAPSKESLRANKYPFVSSIYAAVRKSEDHESMAYNLYQFLFTKKGADMIEESGYIARR